MKVLFTFLLFLTVAISLQAATVSPATGPTVGGTTITITATGSDNFETQGPNSSVTVGSNQSMTIQSWTSVQIIFTLPQGAGAALQVSVNTQSGAVIICSNTFSYNRPFIVNASPLSGPTNGGYSLMLAGIDFGPSGLPATVTLGGVNVGQVTHDHITATFTVPPGYGQNKQIIYTIAGQSDTASGVFNYNSPILNSLSPTSGPTTGGTTVSAFGSNFGPAGTPASVTVGGVTATSVVVHDHDSLTFVTPPGTGFLKNVVITIGSQSSPAVPLWSYQAPTVNSISPGTGPTMGGTLVSITGTNFGPPGSMAFVNIGGSNASSVTVHDHDSLTCLTPQGAGVNKSVIVTVSGQSSPAVPIWSYQAPFINSFTPTSGPAIGGTLVTVYGNNFGPPGTPATAMIGNNSATNVMVTGHSTLTFLSPPGTGTNKAVKVIIDQQQSNNATPWNYHKPVLEMLDPPNGSTTGNTVVTAKGEHFGPPGTIATVVIGGNLASMVTVVNDSTISFTTPPGAGTDKAVLILIDGQSNEGGPTFDYDAPVIFSVTPGEGPTSGGNTVSVVGTNFGPAGTQVYVTVDNIPSGMVTLINHGLLTFVVPPGSGSANEVIVNVAGQNSNASNYMYFPPTVANLSPNSGPEQGGTLVQVNGNNFGPPGTPISVMIDSVPVNNLMLLNHTMITFTTPPGTGSNQPVQINIDGQSILPPPTFSYLEIGDQSVGIGTINPDESAALDITSVTKGLLIPRMTSAERVAIPQPAEGLMVYDTTLKAFYYFNGSAWKKMAFE